MVIKAVLKVQHGEVDDPAAHHYVNDGVRCCIQKEVLARMVMFFVTWIVFFVNVPGFRMVMSPVRRIGDVLLDGIAKADSIFRSHNR